MIGYVVGLVVVIVMALLFGFIANFALHRSSPAKRAGIAGLVVGILATIPAYIALISAGAGAIELSAIFVATLIVSAISFPIALVITRSKKTPTDTTTFE